MSDIPSIEYNLNLEENGVEEALEEYARVICEIRKITRCVKRRDGVVLDERDIIKLVLKYDCRCIQFIIRKQDLYIIGYERIMKDGKTWELKSNIKILEDAEDSGIPIDYSGLTDCHFGWGVLRRAFNVIWKYDPSIGNIRRLHFALQEIILMVCEASRLYPIFAETYDQIASKKDYVSVPRWVDLMAHSWKKMSEAATQPLPTGMKIPEDFDKDAWELYYDHKLDIFDPDVRPEGPYFARLAICYPHIGGKAGEEE